jgi:hypothetical protein
LIWPAARPRHQTQQEVVVAEQRVGAAIDERCIAHLHVRLAALDGSMAGSKHAL